MQASIESMQARAFIRLNSYNCYARGDINRRKFRQLLNHFFVRRTLYAHVSVQCTCRSNARVKILKMWYRFAFYKFKRLYILFHAIFFLKNPCWCSRRTSNEIINVLCTASYYWNVASYVTNHYKIRKINRLTCNVRKFIILWLDVLRALITLKRCCTCEHRNLH